MSESMENNPSLPSINLESSKTSDSYEINVNVLIIIVVVLVLLGVGFFFWRSRSASPTVSPVTPTPTQELVTVAPTGVVTSTPSPTTGAKGSPTATPKVTSAAATPKQKATINVLNGTAATGDAAFLRSKLVADGYSADNVKAGNASSTSAEANTEVVFYPSFPAELKIDLVSLLNTLYASVSSTISSSSGDYDVVITTGKKK
ncbi:LytR C-terminal domain-containing protein [Candidatus Microgenomates bacterium]|nr:LytR C-terminal domain-containing protein [Candidatus Microgenomates bacterium]